MTDDVPSKSKPKSDLDLRNSALPLDQALEEFGYSSDLAGVRQNARSAAMASVQVGKVKLPKDATGMRYIFDALGELNGLISESSQIRSAKIDHLFSRLRSGELVARGFPVHRLEADEAEQVPMFLLDPTFADWRARSLVGHGRHYADVTITAAKVDSPPPSEIDEKSQHQKRGTKPIGPLVADAIDYLRSIDPTFENRSQEKQINEIRAEVARQNPGRYPRNSQPGHTTVWNYLTGRKRMR